MKVQNMRAGKKVDTTPPTLSNIASSALTTTGATITWTTNEPASGQVQYGTTTSYGNSSAIASAFTTAHSIALTGLTPGTLYHYRVTSKDAKANTVTSTDRTFTTTAASTFAITSKSVTNITTTGATINWALNEPAQGWVEYGLTAAYGSETEHETTFNWSAHIQNIAGLTAGTLYHYRVVSVNQSAVTVQSADATFTTEAEVVVPGTTYEVPVEIDATGATDVNTALQSWINSLPSGTAEDPTILLFPSTATYRLAVGGALEINGKSYFYLYGKDPSLVTGATSTVEAGAGCHIHNVGDGSSHFNSPLIIGRAGAGVSHHIKVMGFELSGTHTPRGSALHTLSLQSACGIHCYGNTASPNHDIEIGYNYIHDVGGHALYFRGDNNLPYGLNFHHNVTRWTGTMAVAVTNGQDIAIDDNYFEDVGINPVDFEDVVYSGANPTAVGSAIGRYVNVSVRRNRFDRWGYDEHFQPEPAIYRTSPGYPMTDCFIEDNTFYGGWQNWEWIPPSDVPRYRMQMSAIGVISFYRGVSTNVQIRRNEAFFALEGRFIHAQNVTNITVENNAMLDLVGPNPNGNYQLVGDVFSFGSCTGVIESGSVIN